MAHLYKLSEGSLRQIMRGAEVVDPIMQVLGSKKITSAGNSEKERYRILLSDGLNVISFAMLTTQINDRVVNGELVTNSIIKIKRYITSVINNVGKGTKRVLVILEMETLVPGSEIDKIGDPEQLLDDAMETDASSTVSRPSSTISSGSYSSNGDKPTAIANPVRRTNSEDFNVNLQDQLTHPISSLSPYQNKWVIKARVSNKSQIRTWSNSRGEGQLFSMDLIDESGEIRATVFRDLVDKYFDMIEVDKVYYITKCQLKVANKQFSNLKNDYEMTFSNDTVVQECHDVATSIPQTKYDFVTIDKIANIESGAFIDVLGVCKSVSDLQVFQAKSSGRELKKREVTLVDQSSAAITLTLWGQDAEKFDGSNQPIIGVKGAKVGEFGGGKTLSLLGNSVMKINPDIAESHRLRGWYDNGGKLENSNNISAKSGTGSFQTPWMSFKEVQDQGLGTAEKGDYYQTKGTVLLFRSDNCFYKACPTDDCNKKVVDMQNGMFRCEKCNREYPNFKYRLLGMMNIGDWSGNEWISMFASEVEKILSMTSQQVGEAAESNPDALADIANKANFKQFIFKCRAKMETYNDEARLKTVAVKVDPINYKDYNAHLISRIQQLNG